MIFLPEEIVKCHYYIFSNSCFKKLLLSTHVLWLRGHFYVFLFGDLRVIVNRELLENSSFPIQHFFIFLFPDQLHKHWDTDIIYEWSFYQAKEFPYCKQDQLTRFQLAKGEMTFLSSCSPPCEPAFLQKSERVFPEVGSEQVEAKVWLLLVLPCHTGQCHLSSSALQCSFKNRRMHDCILKTLLAENWGTTGISISGGPHGKMRCWRKLYLHEITSLMLQSPITLSLVLKGY